MVPQCSRHAAAVQTTARSFIRVDRSFQQIRASFITEIDEIEIIQTSLEKEICR